MTNDELDRIERLWSPSPDGWGLDVSTDPDAMQRHAADVLALVAEVRRLRGLVRDAYAEGATDNCGCGGFDAERWEASDARKALEGA